LRVVTMLAVDLAGYTEYSAARDPEEVHLGVRPLMNRLRGLCEQRGGVVPVIEGDGFLAVFGGRESRPDDPRRAVLTAVRLQQVVAEHRTAVVGSFPSLKAALHVGSVVVAPSWEHGGFSIAGDAVNVVSRLCSSAQGGTIVASTELAALVPVHAWGAPRTLAVRNRTEPVEVRDLSWATAGPLANPQPPVSTTRFVERPETEMALVHLRSGQDVQVLGEPGMGKSRLAQEVATRLDVDLVLHSWFQEADREGAVFRDLAHRVVAAFREGDDRTLSGVVWRRLRDLAGESVDTSESDSWPEQLEALVEALVALGGGRRLLVVVEDAQWARQDDLEVLQRLLKRPERRFSVAVTSRVEVDLPLRRVLLEPLSPLAAAQLVEHVLVGAEPEVVRALVDRTSGVPLAVEQYARLLLEDGTIVQEGSRCRLRDPGGLDRLPAGMRLFVSSRLDQLEPATREVLVAAAVAGSVSHPDLVRYLSGTPGTFDSSLEALLDRGFVRWQERDDAQQLAFTHEVLRDVTYQSLLRQQRVGMHLVAARWYSVLPIVQVVSEEARHLEAALSLGSTDCDVVRRAVQVLSEYAASLVEQRTALAVEVIDRAERIVNEHATCNPDTLRLRLTKAETLRRRFREAEAVAVVQECLDESRRQGRDELTAEALVLAGESLALSQPDVARDHFSRAERILTERADVRGLLRLEMARAELLDVVITERLAVMERAHGEAIRQGDTRLASFTAQDLASHSPALRPDVAERWGEVARQMLRRDDLLGHARLLFAEGYVNFARQQRNQALETVVRAGTAARDAASSSLVINAELLTLNCLVESGRLDEAAALAEHLGAFASDRPTERLRVDVVGPSALLLSRQGRPDQAREVLMGLREACEQLSVHHVAEWQELCARQSQDVGHFGDSSRWAQAARETYASLDLAPFALRAECVDLASRTAGGAWIGLGELADARARARDLGSDFALALLSLGRQLTDLLAGERDHEPDLHESVEEVEVRALALETRAFWEQEPDLLLESAATWSQLGTTVWPARALLWHSELTGTSHPEADELLEVLQSPAGLAEHFRSQVRGLRA
jgi:class 3 adenylate cyclase/tetratricopeptide (TPR) repeat protein/adenylate kinase family enzyme